MIVSPHADLGIATRARALYEKIRAAVEPQHNGKFLVLNVETGQYVIDADDVAASDAASRQFPGAPLFAFRIGQRTAYRLG